MSPAPLKKRTVGTHAPERVAPPGPVRIPLNESIPSAWSVLEASRGAEPQRPPATNAPAQPDALAQPDAPVQPVLDSLAAGLQRLSWWVHVRSWRQWAPRQLSPTQLHVLQLLSSREDDLSVTAVARELGLTCSTICDCVAALRNKALVSQVRSTRDGRSQVLKLTPQGQQAAEQAALTVPVVKAFDGLSPLEQACLNVLWMKVLYALELSGEMPRSRMCARCQFFRPFGGPHADKPHYCGQALRPLAPSELRLDCAVFGPAEEAAQPALWEAFVNGPGTAMPTPEPLEQAGYRTRSP
jgi:DNA-binding MarR family transcriptional regulator